MNDTKVTRNYKDTVFRMLYNNKKELLSLYNAVNNTDYINEDVKRKCPSLFQYMQYVNTIRSFANENSLDKAVSLAVDYCISNDILKDFLLANKAEVTSMSIFEYDAELHERTLKEESFKDGYNAGLEESKKIINEKDETIENQKEKIEKQQAEIEHLKKIIETNS